MTAAAYAETIRKELGDAWLPQVYLQKILSGRTRRYHFGEVRPDARVEIQHTLLGVELMVGRRRLLCPDLATARYLSVFARAGCKDVAIPYDISKVSQAADQLESAWYRMVLLVDYHAANQTKRLRNRIRGLLTAEVRTEISEMGAGREIPEFRHTRQRSN